MDILQQIIDSYSGYADYLWKDITLQNPRGFWGSYFWLLVTVSGFFFVLEAAIPWRKNQKVFRKDFWLDFFYMFFNFFIFNLIIFGVGSDFFVRMFNNLMLWISAVDLQALNPMSDWPLWAILLTGFIVRDFVQWWTHRLLHRSSRLWEFHKVHHSVKEMGFAAHLRYHWMETLVYRSIEYIPLALLGVGLHDFFLIHIFTLAWGHYNHANISIPTTVTGAVLSGLVATFILTTTLSLPILETALWIVGSVVLGAFILSRVMKYIFNSPEMHIWHHAEEWPDDLEHGINFGLTLAIWDYIFGTARIPHDGRDIELGFENVERFPSGFVSQVFYGFGKHK